ncbi:MAG: long-chain fatty acid--CoA ligase [Myxococcota bacterium]
MTTRARIEAEILAWMGEGSWREDESRFDRLARDLFAFQFSHCDAYGRFCRGRGVTPERITRWQDIPPVPTGAFKELALRCFPASRTVKTFRTSGTSGSKRGELHLDSLALYEASLLPTLQRFLLSDWVEGDARITLRALVPSPQEAPDSSLSHMLGCVIERFGDGQSGYDVERGVLRTQPLLDQLKGAERPVALCGTAFAFVHLLQWMADIELRLELPAGSRIMETGGFKGRATELPREQLYAALEAAFAVPQHRIVNQYGMTELGSQFYDSVLTDPLGPRRKQGPPWARVRIIDPKTGEPSRPGEVGMMAIHDLANTGSVAAIETADLGRWVEDGFEIMGRAPGAEARGCSLAADAMFAP